MCGKGRKEREGGGPGMKNVLGIEERRVEGRKLEAVGVKAVFLNTSGLFLNGFISLARRIKTKKREI